jgi:hypothetical protein
MAGLKAKAKVGEVELELGVNPETGTADSGDLEADLSELFVAVAEAAADREKPPGRSTIVAPGHGGSRIASDHRTRRQIEILRRAAVRLSGCGSAGSS